MSISAVSTRTPPRTVNRHAPTVRLRRGDRGAAVQKLQQSLVKTGFMSRADMRSGPGVFGPRTEAAVRHFQRSRHITVDGHYGPQSRRSLQDALQEGVQHGRHGQVPGWFEDTFDRQGDARGKLSQGDRGRPVRHLESRLKALGYQPGKLDGKYDIATARAVANFQKRAGVARTGQVNGATARQLSSRRAPRAHEQALERFDRVPPKHDYGRVSYDGATVNKRTREMLKRAETIMAKQYGHKGFRFSLSQGSYNSGYGPSGGTHDRGGAADIRTRGYSKRKVDHMVKALREAGFAAWSRGRGHDSFAPHIHAIAIGDRELSSSARGQVSQYLAGGDGLRGNARDPDRNLGRPVPRWAR